MRYTVKRGFLIFLSPARMSLTQISLGRNNFHMLSLFSLRESLVSEIPAGGRLGTEIYRKAFFTVYNLDKPLIWFLIVLLYIYLVGVKGQEGRVILYTHRRANLDKVLVDFLLVYILFILGVKGQKGWVILYTHRRANLNKILVYFLLFCILFILGVKGQEGWVILYTHRLANLNKILVDFKLFYILFILGTRSLSYSLHTDALTLINFLCSN